MANLDENEPASRTSEHYEIRYRAMTMTDGHDHGSGNSFHTGWKGHGHPAHRHDGSGRTEWEEPSRSATATDSQGAALKLAELRHAAEGRCLDPAKYEAVKVTTTVTVEHLDW